MPVDASTLENHIHYLDDEVYPALKNMKTLLANVDHTKDFEHRCKPNCDNYTYHLIGDPEPFRPTFFGQIAPSNKGTRIEAFITDDTHSIKDIIMTIKLDYGGDKINDLYANQGITLENLVTLDNVEDGIQSSTGGPCSFISNGVITAHLKKKFMPGQGGLVKGGRALPKAKICLDGTDEQAQSEAKKELIAKAQGPRKATEDDIQGLKKGSLLDPRLLPDYDPSIFHLTYNKLIQQDIRDANDKLIPQWEISKALAPGTIVLCRCTIECYNIATSDSKNNMGLGYNHYYQLSIDAIKIIAEKVYIPMAEAIKAASTSKLQQANNDFDTFTVAKCQTDHEKKAQATEKDDREHKKRTMSDKGKDKSDNKNSDAMKL
ncbi:hypothetical protein CPB84DRAFT_1853327 [Gymnopilus junonius]|uniref:Uncharacterized protein n=1 Tax=Gymnopilus junonius TaxID=109634 RepID=A0A9P5NCB1_GYMJU|nr:hypothetical protein CPB84DRAFT_1853327 [Gymnopilus junonius]